MVIIEKKILVLLDHPPFSPDLILSDFYLFRHMKENLRGKTYKNDQDLRQEIEQFLEDERPIIFVRAFLECFEQ